MWRRFRGTGGTSPRALPAYFPSHSSLYRSTASQMMVTASATLLRGPSTLAGGRRREAGMYYGMRCDVKSVEMEVRRWASDQAELRARGCWPRT